jgi:hypothetical protein
MSDIQPHPSLPPVSLQGGERGVAALLLPTTCSPRPGVTVFVLQISNMTSQQVRHERRGYLLKKFQFLCSIIFIV